MEDSEEGRPAIAAILNIAIMAVIVGGLLYVLSLAPIDATIKRIAQVLILILAIVWALKWIMGNVH